MIRNTGVKQNRHLTKGPWGWYLLLAAMVLAGCAVLQSRHEGPGITPADYKDHCGSCHKAPRARGRSDEEWQTFLEQHRFMSGHDAETMQLFIEYLQARN